MKTITSWLPALVIAAFVAASPARAATYNLVFDGIKFDVNALVTTDANDIVVDIAGVMTGPNGYSTQITNIVSTSSVYNGLYWIYNNVFTADAPHVDLFGLLWQNLDGSVANFYLDNGNFVISTANPGTGDFSDWQNVDPGLVSVASIPLPPAMMFLGSGLLGVVCLGRSRKTR